LINKLANDKRREFSKRCVFGGRNSPKNSGRREKGRIKIGRQENQHEKGEGRMSLET